MKYLPHTAISSYRAFLRTEDGSEEMPNLKARLELFSKWTAPRIRSATRDDLIEFLSPLWSLRMWGNRAVYIDQVIEDNGLAKTREALAGLLWGKAPLAQRWNTFRSEIRRIGPAIMSELLAHLHPTECLPWNGVSLQVFRLLNVPKVPTQSYQVDGANYTRLSKIGADIAAEMRAAGFRNATLMEVNYFLWWLNENPEQLGQPTTSEPEAAPLEKTTAKAAEFLHNDVRDKIADIGKWLGLRSQTEVKVANGAVVDAIWEATIGNMGRVIYVFEVQTRGSTDSLLMNLMKSLNNPAVQGVVAVSDGKQLERIKKEAAELKELRDKLKIWDYAEVLAVHKSMESVNSKINALGLVPQGFDRAFPS